MKGNINYTNYRMAKFSHLFNNDPISDFTKPGLISLNYLNEYIGNNAYRFLMVRIENLTKK